MDSQPKERPIIFSTPMVRALIEGRKTQTRRVVKPQPRWIGQPNVPFRTPDADPKGIIACPGNVGDRLWVKETFWQASRYPSTTQCGEPTPERECRGRLVHYAADGNPPNVPNRHYPEGLLNGAFAAPDPYSSWHKRPSIHMPRWASRITLTITDVRVERLQDISPEDVNAEGASPAPVMHKREGDAVFAALWNSISGPGAWDANPWVWAITFTTEVRK